MAIEQKIRDRIIALVQEGESLSRGNKHGQLLNDAHESACVAWMGAAHHVLAAVCASPDNAYREASGRIVEHHFGYALNLGVGHLTALLKQLLIEIDLGLLSSVANQARAETFDDLLDHAARYHKDQRLDGSAILATAVFEDTLRRICRANGIPDKDVNGDTLITALDQRGFITSIVAKRCRAAAGARNKALHAQWDEITLQDVESVIALTRELLTTHLR
jgi:uncharacterized protein YutE (UPF0331/DUF86 family)